MFDLMISFKVYFRSLKTIRRLNDESIVSNREPTFYFSSSACKHENLEEGDKNDEFVLANTPISNKSLFLLGKARCIIIPRVFYVISC